MTPQAGTHPSAPDPRLRGRTYAISFDRVWTAALTLAGGGGSGALPRWRLLSADDKQGVILVEAVSVLRRKRSLVRVRISLDTNAQTRVDLLSGSPGRTDWGSNARRVDRFLRELDRRLSATPAQILDPTRQLLFTA